MRYWSLLNLRVRIYMVLAALVLITLLGGLIMVWYTYRMEGLLSSLIDGDVAAFQAAEALESSLIYQKGFVSYYYQDGDPDWLRSLGEYRQVFRERLEEAMSFAETEREKEVIKRIEREYALYLRSQDQVIEYYMKGELEAGSLLHKQIRGHYSGILEASREFRNFFLERIRKVKDASLIQGRKLRVIAGTAILTVFFLAVLMAFVLVNNVLGPVRRLALEADRTSGSAQSDDEVKALSRSIRGLLEDVDQTHSELERSREHLLQAEKLALVGKLAAGMAHSLRNPLTSVKMRLFSLGRTLTLTPDQKEDFEVISEEIAHTDTIVQNFLEFSRPPKLKMQRVSPSDVVDMAIQLLRHRLESYDVVIRLNRRQRLPRIQGDPEQLKEVLANLVENSCEAMKGKGGTIFIYEEVDTAGPGGRFAVIRLADTGPGIPENIREKLFQPFFTTKEEGSGLGLSIASRIIEEHGGTVRCESRMGEGASFIITLPLKEEDGGYYPDRG